MPIEPKYRAILTTWQENVVSTLSDQLIDVLHSAMIEWQKQLDNPGRVLDRHYYTEAEKEATQHKTKMRDIFVTVIQGSIEHFPDLKYQGLIHEVDTSAKADFTLIEDEIYEHDIVLQNLAGQTAIENHRIIYALTQRLTVINHGHPISAENIPASPQLVTEAFANALKLLSIEKKLLPVLYQQFNKNILTRLQHQYEMLNKMLIETGVLPHLKYIIEQHENYVTPHWLKDSKSRKNTDTEEAAVNNTENIVEQAPELSDPEAISLEDVVVEEIDITAPEEDTLPPKPEKSTPHTDILAQLAQMLNQQRVKLVSHLGANKITPEQKNTIGQIEHLFERLLNDRFLPNIGKALLSRLHMPMMLVALKDKDFFSAPDNPAHQLLNELVDSTRIWISGASLDRGIYPVIKEIVDDIVDNKVTGKSSLLMARNKLRTSVEQLRKKAFILEGRTVEVEKGKSKLIQAKQQVLELTADIFQNKPLTLAGNHFIETIWMDYLTLLLLRDDEFFSPENLHIAQSTGKFILKTDQKAAAGTLETPDLGILKRRISQEVSALIPHHQAGIDQYIQSLNTTPLETARFNITLDDKQESSDDTQNKHLSDTLRHIPLGSYIMFYKEDNNQQMARNCWYNKATDELLFVDHTGRKFMTIEVQQVANRINDNSAYLYGKADRDFIEN